MPPSSPVYYVRIAEELRGPLGVEQLRDLGEAEVIARDSPVQIGASGPWVVLATLPICAEVFPARRTLTFKSAEFETLNHEATPPVDHRALIAHANQPPASLLGREVIVGPNGRPGPRAGEALNEVQLIVQEVGRKVAEHTPPVPLPARRSLWQRWRGLLAVSAVGSGGILSIPLCYDRRYDAMSVSILGGWVVLFNGLLAMLVALHIQLRGRVGAEIIKATPKE